MASDRNTDNWAQYQELVLSELERHDDKQNKSERDITDLRLLIANLSATLAQNTESIKILTQQIKSSETKVAEQAADITLLKYKIGLAASGISTAFTFALHVGMKLMDQSP